MRRIIVLFVLAAFGMLQSAMREPARAQEPTMQTSGITAVLQASADAWSRGDLDAFMRCYEQTDDVSYIKAGGVVRGYAAIRAMYASRFGGARMGRLSLQVLGSRPLGPDHALAIGRFTLARAASDGGDASGIFTLVFHRTSAGWRIIADHTS